MKISIIGSGFVGKSTGKGFSKLGHDVIFYDVNKEQFKDLNNYQTSNNLKEVIEQTEISFICVPTPTINDKQDLHILEDVIIKIRYITNDNIVVVKSTILPFTMESLFYGNDNALYNPEFITQRTNDKTFFNQDFIIIGTNNNYEASKTLSKIYRPLNKPIYVLEYHDAEALKYLYNSFLATKISFWNDAYYKLLKLGIDVKKIAPIIGLDKRIGSYGSKPGQPFKGYCLPKDLIAFISWLKENDLKLDILNQVEKINEKA